MNKLTIAAQTLGSAGGSVGGKSQSPAKQAASRNNGKLGGWPKGRPRKGYVHIPPAKLVPSMPMEEAGKIFASAGGKVGGKVLSEAKLKQLKAAAKKPRPTRRKTQAAPGGK